MAGLALLCVCQADGEIEKADTLVGKTVIVKNVFRSSDGVTIKKLQDSDGLEKASKVLQAALAKYPASFISKVLSTVYVGSGLELEVNRTVMCPYPRRL